MQPKIAAVVLAAGEARRMGRNKLLEEVGGKPMLRHVTEAALASRATPVIVVTGNKAEDIRAVLSPLPLTFRHNPDYSRGLSTSLKEGVKRVPPDCEGAIVLLGDMPGVGPELIDRLVGAFAPDVGRAIIVPVRQGRRGNPVVWARRFFEEMGTLTGDQGARSLFGHYPDLTFEVPVEDEGAFTDIDTEEALMAYRSR